jgi:hypothetical protein
MRLNRVQSQLLLLFVLDEEETENDYPDAPHSLTDNEEYYLKIE